MGNLTKGKRKKTLGKIDKRPRTIKAAKAIKAVKEVEEARSKSSISDQPQPGSSRYDKPQKSQYHQTASHSDAPQSPASPSNALGLKPSALMKRKLESVPAVFKPKLTEVLKDYKKFAMPTKAEFRPKDEDGYVLPPLDSVPDSNMAFQVKNGLSGSAALSRGTIRFSISRGMTAVKL